MTDSEMNESMDRALAALRAEAVKARELRSDLERMSSYLADCGDPGCLWRRLERFADLASAAGYAIDPGDFMLMGDVGSVRLYKHSDTRRYLNLDADGHAYRYADGVYEQHDTPADAIEHALDWEMSR